MHARTRWPSISMQDGSKLFSNPQVAARPQVAHEYELLEILFERVFDRRFVNTKPSCEWPDVHWFPSSAVCAHVLHPISDVARVLLNHLWFIVELAIVPGRLIRLLGSVVGARTSPNISLRRKGSAYPTRACSLYVMTPPTSSSKTIRHMPFLTPRRAVHCSRTQMAL